MPRLRPCLSCGVLTTQTRCSDCRSTRNRARGSSTARGYDAEHRRLREHWRPHVEAGEVDCWRCGRRILAGQAWDSGHDDHDRSVTRGPEHAVCNRATRGR